jgi:hypothetical protein
MESTMRSVWRERDSIRRLCELHVAARVGAIVAATVPFHLHDAMIHIDDDTQFIAVFARNALSDLPVSPVNHRFHGRNLARRDSYGIALFRRGTQPFLTS